MFVRATGTFGAPEKYGEIGGTRDTGYKQLTVPAVGEDRSEVGSWRGTTGPQLEGCRVVVGLRGDDPGVSVRLQQAKLCSQKLRAAKIVNREARGHGMVACKQ